MENSSFEIDAALLVVTQLGSLPSASLSVAEPDFIHGIVTDGVQQLMAALFELPVEKFDEGRIVKLPATKLLLPREKPMPKQKDLTTWQKFATRKGIKSKKRDRLQYDETKQDWRPRYGRNRANDDEGQWCVEHKDRVTTGPDPWTDLRAAKKTRVTNNAAKQQRNLIGAKGDRLPGAIDLASASQRKAKGGVAKEQKGHVAIAYDIAAASTASMGVFDKKADALEPNKDRSAAKAKLHAKASGRADLKSEKSANMALLNRMLGADKSGPKIDKDKAANLQKAKSEKNVHRARANKNGHRDTRDNKRGPGARKRK